MTLEGPTLANLDELLSLYPQLEPKATAALELWLADASSLVRRESMQHVDQRTYTLTLRGTFADRIIVPQQPVAAITEVRLDGYVISDWYLNRQTLHRGRQSEGERVYDMRTKTYGFSWGGPEAVLEVDGTFGYDPVPPWVRSIVLGAAKRAAESASSADGVTQESVGPHSVTYAATGERGVYLTDAELHRVKTLRPKVHA